MLLRRADCHYGNRSATRRLAGTVERAAIDRNVQPDRIDELRRAVLRLLVGEPANTNDESAANASSTRRNGKRIYPIFPVKQRIWPSPVLSRYARGTAANPPVAKVTPGWGRIDRVLARLC